MLIFRAFTHPSGSPVKEHPSHSRFPSHSSLREREALYSVPLLVAALPSRRGWHFSSAVNMCLVVQLKLVLLLLGDLESFVSWKFTEAQYILHFLLTDTPGTDCRSSEREVYHDNLWQQNFNDSNSEMFVLDTVMYEGSP